MQHHYNLYGGSNVIKRYKVASGAIVEGTAVLRAASDTAGLAVSTTTSLADAMGVVVDRGANTTVATGSGSAITYSTTQGDAEAVFGVIINPDAVWRILMTGGATENTAVPTRTVITASTSGLIVEIVTSFDWTSPDLRLGTVWCTSGANVGLSRRIASSGTDSSGSCSVIMPFTNDIAVGDTFLAVGQFTGTATMTLSTLLTQMDATAAITGGAMVCVDFELNGASDSYVHGMLSDQVFKGATT